MDTFERNAARSLAIAYNAYLEAQRDSNPNIQSWAKMLLEAQRGTGIELIPVDRLLYPVGRQPYTPAQAAYCEARASGASRDEARAIADDNDGGALVPSPKPQPRKPSPGAAAQAAAFFARTTNG